MEKLYIHRETRIFDYLNDEQYLTHHNRKQNRGTKKIENNKLNFIYRGKQNEVIKSHIKVCLKRININ